MKTCNFKSRKAISTIVGTFFFVIVMVGAFTAFILMMQTNSNFLNTQLDTTQNEIQKIQGLFTIAAAYDSENSNRLCVSVRNSGSTPLEIADLFIVNKTNNAVRQFDVDFKDAFIPVFSIRDILNNQDIFLTAGTGTIYDIKVVSTSGITQTTELKVFPISNPDPRFNVTAFAYPVNAASGENVTLGAHVFNRMNTTLINVQPEDGYPTVDPDEAVTGGFNLITAADISRLDPNESTVFMWEPEFVGGIGSKLNFTVRVKAQVEGCTTSSFITNEDFTLVKVVPGVRRQILASPETFVTFPNPLGEDFSGSGGFMALAIQNPTNHAFTIPQVSIQFIGPDNPDMWNTPTGVNPTTGWSIAGGTTIVWKAPTTADIVTVGPFDIYEFVVRVPPKSLTLVPVNTITYNVYSSFGQFGKGPFTAGSTATVSTIVNVFSKSSFSGSTPIFIIQDIPSSTVQRFNFTIANVGSGGATQSISAGAYMLINVPSGLRNITNVTDAGDDGEVPVTVDGLSAGLQIRSLLEFDDGSTQIPLKVTTDLIADDSRTYSFRATMPDVAVPTFYIFTIVSNGTTSGGTLLGPFSETVLQICPDEGC